MGRIFQAPVDSVSPDSNLPNNQVSWSAGYAMTDAPFEDRPPDRPHLTTYDERHLVEYLRLLDAAEEGADWREAVQIIFGLDPAQEPDRARIVHDSQLARARWMTETGYTYLLRPPLH
jgi:hypothetical protein